MARAGELGADQALTFLREVDAINMRRRTKVVELAREACGGSFIGRNVAMLGAAFKPDSDDIRDSPALNVAAQMRLQGAESWSPTRPPSTTRARLWPDLTTPPPPRRPPRGADVVLLLTEWPEYTGLDPHDPRHPRARPSPHRRPQRPRPPRLAQRRLDLQGPGSRSGGSAAVDGPPVNPVTPTVKPRPSPSGGALPARRRVHPGGGRDPAALPGPGHPRAVARLRSKPQEPMTYLLPPPSTRRSNLTVPSDIPSNGEASAP